MCFCRTVRSKPQFLGLEVPRAQELLTSGGREREATFIRANVDPNCSLIECQQRHQQVLLDSMLKAANACPAVLA